MSEHEDDTIVTVESVGPSGGTVITGTGTTEDGQTVTFGGDHRAMEAIKEAIANGEEVVVGLPNWSILYVR